MRKVFEWKRFPGFRIFNLRKLRIVHAPTIVIRTVRKDRKPESFDNFQKLTYRRIWDREIVGEDESSEEDESYLNEKQLADILNKYPEYALLYELATINPADGN